MSKFALSTSRPPSRLHQLNSNLYAAYLYADTEPCDDGRKYAVTERICCRPYWQYTLQRSLQSLRHTKCGFSWRGKTHSFFFQSLQSCSYAEAISFFKASIKKRRFAAAQNVYKGRKTIFVQMGKECIRRKLKQPLWERKGRNSRRRRSNTHGRLFRTFIFVSVPPRKQIHFFFSLLYFFSSGCVPHTSLNPSAF